MNITHTTVLTEAQKSELQELVDACKKKEPLSLSAPSEDGLDYLLAYESDGTLLGFLYLFFTEEQTCECSAFVHPEYRRKGIFDQLFNQALDMTDNYEKTHHSPVDFCFLVDEKTSSAMAVMNLLETEYWYSEYKMVRKCRESDMTYKSKLSIISKQDATNNMFVYDALLDGQKIGNCMVLPLEKEDYLFHFEIDEPYQGKGYGKDFLLGMLSSLYQEGYQISLQVSGQNFIARNLYKKTGFQISETLSYYRY